MHLLRFRNVSMFAATRIVSPLLRQIQSRINQTDSIPSPQRAKHSNLTVVLFAQASIPLARHPYRVLAFLLKAAFIDVQPVPICAPTSASVFLATRSMTGR
jgi:hypothetical protein